MATPSDSSAPPNATMRPLRTVAGFVSGTVVWMALFTLFVAFYPAAWGYGVFQAVLAALAWCMSTALGAAVYALVAQERTSRQGARSGVILGFVVAGGGLLYSVTGHRPANSDAWPTDLLLWGIALGMAMASGLVGGWIASAALSRKG
jgi:dolichyl-phosphate-mannose--protein O-mannosyl transferase